MKLKNLTVISFLVLSLSACTNSTADSSVGMGGGDTFMSMPSVDKSLSTGEQFSNVASPTVIRTADLSISTNEVETTVSKVEEIIKSSSGRVETSSFYQDSNGFNGSAFISARIPEAKLDEVISKVSELGKQISLNINSTDVTLQTIDIKAKIAALTESRDRLQSLLDEATSVSDLIAAEDALSARQSELESYQDQLDYLSGQVAESTLSIQILDDATSLTSGLQGFKATMIKAAQNFLQAFEKAFVFVITAIPWVLIIGAFGFIGKLITGLIKKKRN